MTANHDDLQRSLGRVEGNQDAMEARMDRFEKALGEGFTKVEDTLEKINARLARIETKEAERKGALAVLAAIGAVVVGIVSSLITKFFGG